MTTRGEEVFRLIGLGHSLSTIAWRLDLNVAAVRKVVLSLHEELGHGELGHGESEAADEAPGDH